MADDAYPPTQEEITLDCDPDSLFPPEVPGPPMLPPTATTSPDAAAPQIFHQFLELPPELRSKIWELSLPHRVHTLPRPSKKYDFLNEHWTQEQVYGSKAEKRPVIAHVCSEARTVALATGSSKKILISGANWYSDRLSRVWVDWKRDTAVINMGQPVSHNSGKLYRTLKDSHIYSLLRNRDMHIALDLSWALCFCMMSNGRARELYYDLVRGRKECDFVVLDLQLDVTDEEAAGTGLFGDLDADSSVLVSIKDTPQMSRLFDAQARFNAVDWLNKWDNFTRIRNPNNLVDFVQRWKKLAAREMRNVQRGLDFLTEVEVGRKGKSDGEIREQIARARAVRGDQPKLRPVIMVSRGVGSSR